MTARFNLDSKGQLNRACDANNLEAWLTEELSYCESPAVRAIVDIVRENLSQFVSFPKKAILLWDGSDRIRPKDARQKIHKFPNSIQELAKERKIDLDTRSNGPAVAAFHFAGGVRGVRSGSTNAWSVHHLYSGKFRHTNGNSTFHAVKDGKHFSQSAGLIAAHPVADALCDELPCFTWYLRARAFQKFGYDPDKVFGKKHDSYGFIEGKSCQILHVELTNAR